MRTIHQGIGFSITADFPATTLPSDITIALRNPANRKSYLLTTVADDEDTVSANLTAEQTSQMTVGTYNLEIYSTNKANILYFEQNFARVIPSSQSVDEEKEDFGGIIVKNLNLSYSYNIPGDNITIATTYIRDLAVGRSYMSSVNSIDITKLIGNADTESWIGACLCVMIGGDAIEDSYICRGFGETIEATQGGSLYLVWATKDAVQDADQGGVYPSLQNTYKIDVTGLTIVDITT